MNENAWEAICSRVRWSIRNCWEIGSESPGTSARADRITDHTANASPADSPVRAPTPSARTAPRPFADHQARSRCRACRPRRRSVSGRETSLISRNRQTTTRPAMFVIFTNITSTAASGMSHQANRLGHAHSASSAKPAPVASTMASTLTIEDISCTEYPAASVAPAPNAAHRPAPSRRASSQVRQAPSASQIAPVSRISVTGSSGSQPPSGDRQLGDVVVDRRVDVRGVVAAATDRVAGRRNRLEHPTGRRGEVDLGDAAAGDLVERLREHQLAGAHDRRRPEHRVDVRGLVDR